MAIPKGPCTRTRSRGRRLPSSLCAPNTHSNRTTLTTASRGRARAHSIQTQLTYFLSQKHPTMASTSTPASAPAKKSTPKSAVKAGKLAATSSSSKSTSAAQKLPSSSVGADVAMAADEDEDQDQAGAEPWMGKGSPSGSTSTAQAGQASSKQGDDDVDDIDDDDAVMIDPNSLATQQQQAGAASSSNPVATTSEQGLLAFPALSAKEAQGKIQTQTRKVSVSYMRCSRLPPCACPDAAQSLDGQGSRESFCWPFPRHTEPLLTNSYLCFVNLANTTVRANTDPSASYDPSQARLAEDLLAPRRRVRSHGPDERWQEVHRNEGRHQAFTLDCAPRRVMADLFGLVQRCRPRSTLLRPPGPSCSALSTLWLHTDSASLPRTP